MERLIDKEVKTRFERKRYLLGIRKEDNKKVYLTEASWDCDWYWGFGYVNTFTPRNTYDHQHFDDLFLEKNIFYSFKEYFKNTTLNDEDIFILLNYMKEFYICKKYAEVLRHGGYITTKALSITEEKNKEANQKEIERINKILLPELFEKIYKLLEG